ncbi:hypothetical protein F2Q69_00022560 [Brassica cretica]|uniref:Uncharacterized protein n=1 Tax=Brassica cretica TaxID=69181 RepID=A0A8S9QDR4_BRACR|nr:hypothetical protein F2Q69_00022560 [Brassica cretica]
MVSAPEVEIQPSGSSTTPARAVDAGPAHESMPPPPAKREIVLGLPALSTTLAAAPKSRKRPSANPDAAKRKRCDIALSECGSEVKRLAKELEESGENSSQLEGKLKTASSLIKAKDAKASKSSELRRLKRKVKSGEGSMVCAIREGFGLSGSQGGTNKVGEASQSPRAEEAALSVRGAEPVDAEGDLDLILAGLKSQCVLPSCSGEPVGQDPTAVVQDPTAEDAGGSMAPNPKGREDYELSSRRLTLGVLLYLWSVSRVSRSAKTRRIFEDARTLAKRQILESRIRMFDTMPRAVRDQCVGFKGLSSPYIVVYRSVIVGWSRWKSSIFRDMEGSPYRQFAFSWSWRRFLEPIPGYPILGILSVPKTGTRRYPSGRTAFQELIFWVLRRLEFLLRTQVRDGFSVEDPALVVFLQLEWDLRKTASSLLKAKEAKASKSLELRRLKRKVKSGEGSMGFGLAGVKGGTNEVGEVPQSPRAEEAALSVRRAEPVDAKGYFDLILAGLKSECILLSCSGEAVGQDPITEDAGGSMALNPEGVIGEAEAPRAEDD